MTVACDTSGMVIAGTHVPWSAVLEVFAYKEDLFSVDKIHLGFRTSDDGSFWTVSEEWTGYKALLAELPHHFPGIRTDWFFEVAIPAFATNRTTLWRTAFVG